MPEIEEGRKKNNEEGERSKTLAYLIRVDLESLLSHVRHEPLEVGDVGVSLIFPERVHAVLHHVVHFFAAQQANHIRATDKGERGRIVGAARMTGSGRLPGNSAGFMNKSRGGTELKRDGIADLAARRR